MRAASATDASGSARTAEEPFKGGQVTICVPTVTNKRSHNVTCGGVVGVILSCHTAEGPTSMSDLPEPGPAFTLVQLATLAAWSASRPRGFRHVLAQAYEQQDEVAEMTQREAHDHLYRIYPTVDGRVCLEMTHGGDAWEMGTIEEALAGLLVLEEELEIEWAAFAR